jgi:ribonuclease Z
VYNDGEVKVIAFAVNHGPVKPAFGYRFESGGRTIVITGDCHADDTLARNAKDADVLVSEVLVPEYIDKVHAQQPEIAARLKQYHSTPEEAATAAAKARVKLLVFTHIVSPDYESVILERARKYFSGEIVVGKDLMKF